MKCTSDECEFHHLQSKWQSWVPRKTSIQEVQKLLREASVVLQEPDPEKVDPVLRDRVFHDKRSIQGFIQGNQIIIL